MATEKTPVTPLFYSTINLNLVQGCSVYHWMYPENVIWMKLEVRKLHAMVTKFPLQQIFLMHFLFSSIENSKDKDQLMINWKDYCDKQVPQLSRSNWSDQF